MKSIIIYESVHHQNTEKVAKVIADEIDAELINVKEFNGSNKNLDDYDLVGFGSGIFYSKVHKNIREFIKNIEHRNNQKAFIFTTSGRGTDTFNEKFKETLSSKGFDVVGDFTCKGFDTFLPLKLIGGINKGRPNEEDLANARTFAKLLL